MMVALLCLLSQTPAGTSEPDPALIRVYIDTRAAVGDPAALQQSARDLTAALARQKKLFTIVDDEDKADVALEVQDRTLTTPKIVIGIGSGPGSNPAATAPVREGRLRVGGSLVHADESIEIRNKNRVNDHPGGWKSAAEDIAKQVEKWVKDRRAKILAARPKGPNSRGFSMGHALLISLSG